MTAGLSVAVGVPICRLSSPNWLVSAMRACPNHRRLRSLQNQKRGCNSYKSSASARFAYSPALACAGFNIVKNQRNRQAIEAAEQYADGLIRKRDMKKSRKAACMPWLTSFDAYEEAASTMEAATLVLTTQQQMVLDDLLSDVAGNLDQKMTLRPSWLRRNGGIVARIAQTIYAEQSFADLPILADALEEAGCDNADILTHCRQPGEHARGCWVLDLLLGKK
jgi:hypothetical protein